MAIFTPERIDLERALGTEWWLGDAHGGWASASLGGALTRKYHALLSVAHPGVEGRWILLGKYEETALAEGRTYPLSINCYPGVVHPRGDEYLERFLFDGAVARWTYRVAGRRLAKEVWCERTGGAIRTRYTLLEGEPLGLQAIPLVNGRRSHGLGLPEAMRARPGGEAGPTEVRYAHPLPWGIQASSGLFRPKPEIYRNLVYAREGERGEADREDWASPGQFEFLLREGQQATLRAWAQTAEGSGERASGGWSEPEEASRRVMHRVDEMRIYNGWDEVGWLEDLLRASDSLFVREGERFDILAGYPYFGVWARDALISVPGLCIYTGRHALGRDILLHWTGRLRDGLLPNHFDEQGEPVFESADGTLWLFWAMSQLQSEGGMTPAFLGQVWPSLRDNLMAWMADTRFTRLGSDGLVSLMGDRQTWMDAAQDGQALTPRAGRRVEINALWIHALHCAAHWAAVVGDAAAERRFGRAAQRARGEFKAFYNPARGCFYDGLDGPDASVRPNQLWAIALPSVGVEPAIARRALGVLEAELWAPGAGVRTLATSDARYHPRFEGDGRARDRAYHNGAVWPWLSGVWTEAWLRTDPQRREALERQLEVVRAPRMPGTRLGVAEVHDPASGADGGCPLQAWSVAELMRAGVLLERARRWSSAQAILSPGLSEILAPMRPAGAGRT